MLIEKHDHSNETVSHSQIFCFCQVAATTHEPTQPDQAHQLSRATFKGDDQAINTLFVLGSSCSNQADQLAASQGHEESE